MTRYHIILIMSVGLLLSGTVPERRFTTITVPMTIVNKDGTKTTYKVKKVVAP